MEETRKPKSKENNEWKDRNETNERTIIAHSNVWINNSDDDNNHDDNDGQERNGIRGGGGGGVIRDDSFTLVPNDIIKNHKEEKRSNNCRMIPESKRVHTQPQRTHRLAIAIVTYH
mmetsp:Transcript_25346/g.28423  ORF Transcript_25346/g.28423 Transcript_25346/m.28423 type:complete len:116 (+) Transcript_25346:74-421(+)